MTVELEKSSIICFQTCWINWLFIVVIIWHHVWTVHVELYAYQLFWPELFWLKLDFPKNGLSVLWFKIFALKYVSNSHFWVKSDSIDPIDLFLVSKPYNKDSLWVFAVHNNRKNSFARILASFQLGGGFRRTLSVSR